MADEVNNSSGPYNLVWSYLTPGKDRSESYTGGDWYTAKMVRHPAVERARSDAQHQIALDCYRTCASGARGKISYDLGKQTLLGNISDLLRTLIGFGTNGFIGKDPAYGVVGSFGSRSAWTTKGTSCENGTATIRMHIENQMGAASMTRYGYTRSDQTLLSNNPLGSEAPLATVRQSWDWEENITFPSALGCDKK